MTGLPFDPRHPPEHPPPQVRRPLLWRMGWRLVTDHRPPPVSAGLGAPECRSCARGWPCEPYLLGRRGLVASLTDPAQGHGRRGEVADGRLVLAPPPSREHERVVGNLAARIRRELPDGSAVRTGQPVRLPGGDTPVPDLLVTTDVTPGPPAPSAVHTVVEVIGDDGRFLDRVWKRERFAAAGVPCFWRVELWPWPGFRGPSPLVVARVRETGRWREVVVTAGEARDVPLVCGRAPGGEAVTVPVRLDPAVLTKRDMQDT
jgi:hypothetical protein